MLQESCFSGKGNAIKTVKWILAKEQNKNMING